jgi:peptide/nickel transport system permease protein
VNGALYIGQRLGKGVVVVLAIVIVNFLLIRMAPGDPAMVMAGESGAADAVYVAQLRKEFGLDRPIPEQLGIYVSSIARLDLGYSHRMQRPVLDMIVERLPATLLLTVTAYLFSLLAGITLGAFAAARAGSLSDTLITVFSLIFYATPIFWVGLMGILLFTVTLGWLPAFGMASVTAGQGRLAVGLDIARHLILPALTLGLFHMAVYARLTRASMLEVFDLDYVRTARAKGLPRGRVVRMHVLRNAVLPVLTFAGLQAGQLIGGAIVVETVFAWPGIGRLAFDALMQRDYATLLGAFVFTSAMGVVFNLLTDLAYLALNPQITLDR